MTGQFRTVGVLMMAYGGPNSLDEVEPYLLDVREGRPTAPELVEEIRHRYAQIGGRSPLLEITRAQARALEERLNEGVRGQRSGIGEGSENERGEGPKYRVYVGMRHWHPYIMETVAQMVEDGVRDMVALCMAPHYSKMSIETYFRKLREAQEALGEELNVAYVESWHDHPLFVQALAERVREGLGRFPKEARQEADVVFSAHSLPASIVEQGDPYQNQLLETARVVAGAAGLKEGRWRFCYQSAGARPVPWLGPSIEEVIGELAQGGHRWVLVAPIGFVADHVEVLYDIDVEAKRLAEEAGVRLERTEGLNTDPLFIEALAEIVRDKAKRL